MSFGDDTLDPVRLYTQGEVDAKLRALRETLARELEAQEKKYRGQAEELYRTTMVATPEYRYGYAAGLREGFRNAACRARARTSSVDVKEGK